MGKNTLRQSQPLLKARAEFIRKIRQFFDLQGVLEVQTAVLLDLPTTDVYIDSLVTAANKKTKYLHTSAELEMKKLLANGSGDIYQICAVFRDNEYGQRNLNEFTLLEYYRLGFDMHTLMADVTALLKMLGLKRPIRKLSYAQAFFDYANIDILSSDLQTLRQFAQSHQLNDDFAHIEDLQMLLFVHLIEPKLKALPACFIYDYPYQQSAFAKTQGKVAYRFELYLFGVEIANGYDELQTAEEYAQRFALDINKRKTMLRPNVALDEAFLHALANKPLPQCAGVAIGIDRLLSVIDTAANL